VIQSIEQYAYDLKSRHVNDTSLYSMDKADPDYEAIEAHANDHS
jgi:hypothetical protein